MATERHDCTWCGSASSVEYGVCQVCLMEFPNEAIVIKLPLEKIPRRVSIEPREARVND